MPHRATRILITALITVAMVCATASSASALSLGMQWTGIFEQAAPEMNVVGKSGASLFRLTVKPGKTPETSPGVFNWSYYDTVVGEAAKNGVRLLPHFEGRFNGQLGLPDAGEKAKWIDWAKQAVRRYGHNGVFWSEKPSIPATPVTAWEMWNEPNNPGISGPISGTAYGNYLAWAGQEIQETSKSFGKQNTGVLFGGVVGGYNSFVNDVLAVPGAISAFTGFSFHPYALDAADPYQGFINNVNQAKELLKNNALSKTLWITEIGWPVEAEYAVSESTQAELLTKSFNWSKNNEAAYNLQAVIWYNHRDINVNNWAYHCGLRKSNGEARASWYAFQTQTGAPPWTPPVEGTPPPPPPVIEVDYSPGPRTIVDNSGTIHVFYRSANAALGHPLGHHWYTPGAPTWGVETLGGSVAAGTDPHVTLDNSGTIHVFYRSANAVLGHHWYTPGAPTWGVEALGGSLGSGAEPLLAVLQNGSLHVFYRHANGGLGHHWYTSGAPGWGFEILGGSLASGSDPRPIVDQGGTLHVFYRHASGVLGHNWFAPGGSVWGIETLGGSLGSTAEPHAAVASNGVIHVFYRNSSGSLAHHWFEPWNPTWGSETLDGSLASEPHIALDQLGTIHVFYRNSSGSLGHHWFEPWNPTWQSETLAVSLASEPHVLLTASKALHVFYRNSSGSLGHNWHLGGASSWGSEPLGGSLAAAPPVVTTGGSTIVSSSSQKVEGVVNAERSPTSYYFEYGTTTSYGSKQPVTAKSIGYGSMDAPVNETLTGLTASTLYHYRLVATGPEGTVTGSDKTFTTESGTTAAKLASLAVTEPFDGSPTSLANFNANWTALGWANGSPAKGEDSTSGWRPANAHPTVAGASYNTTVTDGGSGVASVATLATLPSLASRYVSVWLDMPTPGGTKAGYELRLTETSTLKTLDITLSKWSGGTKTELASKTGYAAAHGHSFALVDVGGTVSAWVNTGSGFSPLLSANDSSYSSGKAGLEASGTLSGSTNFKTGSL